MLLNGVLRSDRPSVSDWAHGPDSESSPGSEEVQLNPYDASARQPPPRGASPEHPPKSPGSVKHGRQEAERTMGMNFMTSALHD